MLANSDDLASKPYRTPTCDTLIKKYKRFAWNVEVTGVKEPEKQVYNQADFATPWEYEVWLFS
jgi:hypothetical protein